MKTVLFNMAPLKAPGNDGYHAIFFQSQWESIGEVVCEWVKGVFNGQPTNLELNNTLIVLISKVAHPRKSRNFDPSIFAQSFINWL